MSKSSLTDTHTTPSNKSVFERSREIADQAASGGPGKMKGAVSPGANQSELEDLIHQAVPIEPAPYVFA